MLQQLQVYLQETTIRLWRERVGEEKQTEFQAEHHVEDKVFYSLVEDYLRKEKNYIQFDDVMQESQFMGVRLSFSMKSPIAWEKIFVYTRIENGKVELIVLVYSKTNYLLLISKQAVNLKQKKWQDVFVQMTAYAIMVEEV